jgi:hypothetical protein
MYLLSIYVYTYIYIHTSYEYTLHPTLSQRSFWIWSKTRNVISVQPTTGQFLQLVLQLKYCSTGVLVCKNTYSGLLSTITRMSSTSCSWKYVVHSTTGMISTQITSTCYHHCYQRCSYTYKYRLLERPTSHEPLEPRAYELLGVLRSDTQLKVSTTQRYGIVSY